MILPPRHQNGKGLYCAVGNVSAMQLLYNCELAATISLRYPLIRSVRKPAFAVEEYQAGGFALKGINALGVNNPPSIDMSLNAILYDHRKILCSSFNFHVIGFEMHIPLGISTIRDPFTDSGNIMHNPRHRCWRANLSYGFELAEGHYPIYFTALFPFSDKPASENYREQALVDVARWDFPDPRSLFSSWLIGAGVRAVMF